MPFGNQLSLLFEGWGLKEPGLRLSDLGRQMGWQNQLAKVCFMHLQTQQALCLKDSGLGVQLYCFL